MCHHIALVLVHIFVTLFTCWNLGVPKSSPWELSQRAPKIQLGIVTLATHSSSGGRIQSYWSSACPWGETFHKAMEWQYSIQFLWDIFKSLGTCNLLFNLLVRASSLLLVAQFLMKLQPFSSESHILVANTSPDVLCSVLRLLNSPASSFTDQ